MYLTNTNNGFSLKAYRGSLMTLLAMNLDEKPADGSFAGFTIFYINPKGERKPIQNLINFSGSNVITGSDISPIQKFNWVHFPGSYQQTGMLTGKYTYEATPRYFDAAQKLLPLDESKTVRIKDADVNDFTDGKVSVGFTRAFVKSQAFSNRYGAKQKLLPAGDDWIFDTSKKAGTHARYGDFTYEDMYAWLGFNARTMLYGLLSEALHSTSVSVEMFAYDFNDPVIANICLQLAAKGQIRIIMDNAALHTAPDKAGNPSTENNFETRFNAKARNGAALFRCRFARYAHCKEIILKKNNKPYKVLTGSTNFSYTGLYVNANHVLVFDDEKVAGYYSDIFNACWQKGTAKAFRSTPFAAAAKKFTGGMPVTELNVSPHSADYAKQLLDDITAMVNDKKNSSVLFSVMEMGEKSTGSLIPALRQLHHNDALYTYGITDNSSGEISLYKPGVKNGLLIDAKKASRELPPPFKQEFALGLMHAIHHKFVITNFNKKNARVYCGSSNLALGGETDNGDNLLCIKDTDVATVFAIEALRLTDHYNYRSLKDKKITKAAATKMKPLMLDKTGRWVDRFYDEKDIRCLERKLFA